MTKQNSIQQISGMLEKPGAMSDADLVSIASFRQSFPYFVPVRYMDALANHRKNPFAPAMLSAVRPYMGDWLMLYGFLQAGGGNTQLTEGKAKVAQQADNESAPKVLKSDKAAVNEVVINNSPEPIKSDSDVVQGPVEKNELPPVKSDAEVGATGDKTAAPGQRQEPAATDEMKETEINEVLPEDGKSPAVEDILITNVTMPIEQHESVDPFAELMDGADVRIKNESVAGKEPMQEDAKTTVPPTLDAPTNIKDRQDQVKSVVAEIERKHWIVDEIEPAAVENLHDIIPAGQEEILEISVNDGLAATNMEIGDDDVAGIENELSVLDDIDQHAGKAEDVQSKKEEKPLINPVYTEDYFLQQGVKVSQKIPDHIDDFKTVPFDKDDKSLMVMMSFSEWLMHFKSTSEKQKEETKDQKALKSMWQKEKLAAALEEENEEIPENVFEMAVNSIAKEDGLASESLAEIYMKQEKYDKAIEMYRKLSLRNPQKNAYFARKIEEILKEKQS